MRVKRASSKMKLLWKQYGLVAIGTYTALYVAGFGGVYLVLVTGLVEPDVRTTTFIPTCTRVIRVARYTIAPLDLQPRFWG